MMDWKELTQSVITYVHPQYQQLLFPLQYIRDTEIFANLPAKILFNI